MMALLCVQEVHTVLLSCDAQVRAGLSDGRVQVLSRTDEDLAWMMKRLVDCFPDDRDTLSNQLLSRLLRVRAAEQSPDPECKVQEINKLLTTIVHLPLKFSQSEPVRTFFGLDQDSSPDLDLKTGLSEDSPEESPLSPTEVPPLAPPEESSLSPPEESPLSPPEEPRGPGPDPLSLRVVNKDALRCVGFCLANTETILYDQSERGGEGAGPWESGDRRSSADTSCLGHAPGRGLSQLIGRVVKGRSLKMKKANGVEDAERRAEWKYDTR